MQVDTRLLDAVGPAVAEAFELRLLDKVTVIECRPCWHPEEVRRVPALHALLDFFTPPSFAEDRYRERYAALVVIMRRAGFAPCQLTDRALCRIFELPTVKLRELCTMADRAFEKASA